MSDTQIHEEPHNESFKIQIDRRHYTITEKERTGLQLRNLEEPPIKADRDLFEVLPDGLDRKVENDYVAEIYTGKRFFTAPNHINPGY